MPDGKVHCVQFDIEVHALRSSKTAVMIDQAVARILDGPAPGTADHSSIILPGGIGNG